MRTKPAEKPRDSLLPEDLATLHDPAHYRYAGQTINHVLHHALQYDPTTPLAPLIDKAIDTARKKNIGRSNLYPVIKLKDDQRYIIAAVSPDETSDTLSVHYLLPYYRAEHHDLLKQQSRMVGSRVSRFFDAAQPGIRPTEKPTGESILHAMDAYRHTGEGGPQLVGNIMARLACLGEEITRIEKAASPDNQHPLLAQPQLVSEFRYFTTLLSMAGEKHAHAGSAWNGVKWDKLPETCPSPPIDGDALLRTVHLADGTPDRDGTLSYFTREPAKILATETGSNYAKRTFEERQTSRKNMEKLTREAVSGNVAWACGAIDHVRSTLHRQLINNKGFNQFLHEKRKLLPTLDNGEDAAHYAALINDFANKARIRAAVRFKDSVHFKMADAEFRAAGNSLHTLHNAIRGLENLPPQIRDGAELADEAITLCENMAQSRMPRDCNAPAFASNEERGKQSSVGLLDAQFNAWAKRPYRSLSPTLAAAFTAREVKQSNAHQR